MAARRVSDWAFFLYFTIQIPTTLVFDTQGVYWEGIYPGWAKSMRSHYLSSFKDPFLENAWQYPWYLSICLVEHFIELPFFFWAAYVYYKHGAENRPRVVTPSLIYAIHTITAVLSVWAAALGSDFSQSGVLAPRTLGERLNLCFAYSPFLIMSVWIAVDSFILLSSKMKKD